MAPGFEGSAEEGLSRDDEAAEIWLKHLPESHIINGNKHDNFVFSCFQTAKLRHISYFCKRKPSQ